MALILRYNKKINVAGLFKQFQFVRQSHRVNERILLKQNLTRSNCHAGFLPCSTSPRQLCTSSNGRQSDVNKPPLNQDVVVDSQLTNLQYEQLVDETLESLTEIWEDLGDSGVAGNDFDINYSSGVLTVKLGPNRGTYVINKQTPNKQIWFSSPVSGPKRYDFIDGEWVYKHDRTTMHDLLTSEVSEMLKVKTDFTKCSRGHKKN